MKKLRLRRKKKSPEVSLADVATKKDIERLEKKRDEEKRERMIILINSLSPRQRRMLASRLERNKNAKKK
jgi:DNA-directed RNA polymerase specialized sigma24 family protein